MVGLKFRSIGPAFALRFRLHFFMVWRSGK